MILVTGTKRSGTSMWMQVMRAAGLDTFGAEFPKDWGSVIRDANPGGFFESRLRQGIHHGTNPHPRTGEYIHPSEARGLVVKVFVPGLVRSDLAFIERVIGTMREWREYSASLTRLYAMERLNRPAVGDVPAPVYVPPELEWWAENYALIADHLLRRYPLHLVAYDEVLTEPERVIRETIQWLGVGDADAAIAAVTTEYRTQNAVEWPRHESITDAHAATFDELYRRVRSRQPLDGDFIDQLNHTHDALRPALTAAMKVAGEHQRQRRLAQRAARAAVGSESSDGDQS